MPPLKTILYRDILRKIICNTLYGVPLQLLNLLLIGVLCTPLLEYGCQLCNHKNIQLLERIQHCAACWVYGSRWDPSISTWTKPSDQCLEELGWPSLKSHHDYLSVSLLYDIIHNKITVKFNDFCSFVYSCTRYHSFCIALLQSIIISFHFFVFGNTPFIWNKIPFSILSLSNRDAFCHAVLSVLVPCNTLFVLYFCKYVFYYIVCMLLSFVCIEEAPLCRPSLLAPHLPLQINKIIKKLVY